MYFNGNAMDKLIFSISYDFTSRHYFWFWFLSIKIRFLLVTNTGKNNFFHKFFELLRKFPNFFRILLEIKLRQFFAE